MEQREGREIAICGYKAVAALFERRPHDAVRLFFEPAQARRIFAFSAYMARERRPFREVGADELQRVAGTVHHGGVVAIARERLFKPVYDGDIARWAAARTPVLLLDRISNAHNLGALARTAAFFGVGVLVYAEHPEQALLTEAAYRVAEGGLEFLEVRTVPSLPTLMREMRQRFYIVGSSPRGEPLGDSARAIRDYPRSPALVLGNEEMGMSAVVAKECDRLVQIEGAGGIESLNVAAAAAILIREFFAPRAGDKTKGRARSASSAAPGAREKKSPRNHAIERELTRPSGRRESAARTAPPRAGRPGGDPRGGGPPSGVKKKIRLKKKPD